MIDQLAVQLLEMWQRTKPRGVVMAVSNGWSFSSEHISSKLLLDDVCWVFETNNDVRERLYEHPLVVRNLALCVKDPHFPGPMFASATDLTVAYDNDPWLQLAIAATWRVCGAENSMVLLREPSPAVREVLGPEGIFFGNSLLLCRDRAALGEVVTIWSSLVEQNSG